MASRPGSLGGRNTIPTPYLPPRQPKTELAAFRGQEGVRRLQQDAGAVAGLLLRPRRAAVLEVAEDLERLHDDVVRRPALDVDDEPEATRVVLERRIVQALRGRKPCFCCHVHPLYGASETPKFIVQRSGALNAT